MKKVLNEQRLRELAGILLTEGSDGDTVSLYKTQRADKKRARHAAEKDFFGSEVDPLVTTDVPRTEKPDPNATQPLTPAQLDRIEKDIPDESRRPVSLNLYRSMIEPKYSEDDIEVIAHNDDDVRDSLAQLIGWFHPAFQDSRGRPTYDNPSRLGVQVAQEFEKEGLDIIDDAKEFSKRIEKHMYDEAIVEFALAKAHRAKQPRHPDFDRPPSAMQTPGTPEHDWLRKMRQQMDAPDGVDPTQKLVKK